MENSTSADYQFSDCHNMFSQLVKHNRNTHTIIASKYWLLSAFQMALKCHAHSQRLCFLVFFALFCFCIVWPLFGEFFALLLCIKSDNPCVCAAFPPFPLLFSVFLFFLRLLHTCLECRALFAAANEVISRHITHNPGHVSYLQCNSLSICLILKNVPHDTAHGEKGLSHALLKTPIPWFNPLLISGVNRRLLKSS